MYYIQNCFTGHCWKADASEARFYASDDMVVYYNVYRVGSNPVLLTVYDIV